MKKFLKCIALTVFVSVLCFAIFVSGCTTTTVGISSIECTSSDGNVDTYTIYYTDGTTSTYQVTNGSDGKDGADGKDGEDSSSITVEDLYNYYVSVYGDIEYSEFLEKYFSTNTTTTSTTIATSSDSVSAINSCLLSAASVYCEYEYTYYTSSGMGYGPGGGNYISHTAVACASGSAILYEKGDEYSYFVTNYHVVYEADYGGISETIHLYLYGSEIIPSATYNTSGYATSYDYGDYAIECEYVGGSAASDIAVLRVRTSEINAINPDFKAVTFADGYHVGETVFTIGNAESEGLSVTEGIISVDSETISLSVDGTYRNYRSIRIDTAVYEGNSGGGLFNSKGELVGLVNAGSSSDQNINYAIPLTIVTGTADNIIYYYEDGDEDTSDSYGITIGITYTTANSKYVYDSESGYGEITEDIIISGITENSIAATIGFEEDDIITGMTITDSDGNTNTYQITRSFNITDLILTLRVGYTISFSYTRDETTGTTSEYTITSSDLIARG